MKTNFSKILISFLIVAVIMNGFIVPRKAHALVVFDPSNLGAKLTDIAEKVARWVKEDLVRGLRDVIAKRIIDYIVDQTIVWIQGGGKPKFVTDWDGFLKDAANIAFDQVIKDVGSAWLCSPFKLQVQLSLLPVQRFRQRIECTLDDVVKNIEDFYRDFEKGGWIAYNEAWQPQNNYYGQIIIIHDEMLVRAAKKTEAAKSEAQTGKGFLSEKRCVDWSSEGLQSCVDSGESFEDCKKAACMAEKIVTPGAIVGEAAKSAVTSDKDWAANIQSWTAALINAVINRLVKEGIGLMKGSGEGEGTSYYPSKYKSAADVEIEQQKQQLITQVKKFVNEWQYLFDAKNKSLSYANQIKTIYLEINRRKCQPPVSDTEMQNTQADINRLTNEIADLKLKIDEGNNLITKITNANTIRERTIAQQDFLAFMDKYNTPEIQEQIITGSARSAADQELATKTSDLSIAQGRLATCSISP
jgi:hypothetical protein